MINFIIVLRIYSFLAEIISGLIDVNPAVYNKKGRQSRIAPGGVFDFHYTLCSFFNILIDKRFSISGLHSLQQLNIAVWQQLFAFAFGLYMLLALPL